MMDISKKQTTRQDKKRKVANKKWALLTSSLGVFLMILPSVLLFFNPILMLANYQLRVGNGTMLHKLLMDEIEGAKIYMHLFNYTNVAEYLSGDDDKLKLEEVGPFVYQEFRTNDDLEINREPGIMRYTPHYRTELVIEESVGRPEDFELFIPNVAFLSAINMLNKYPAFIGQLFRMVVSRMNLKPIPKVTAYDYLWGNMDPLITVINSAAPGLIYYNCTGLLTRFYDEGVKYRLTLGTSEADKFQVKSVESLQIDVKTKLKSVNTKTFTDAYEGAVFPPPLTPSTPVNLYRYAICKPLIMSFVGTKTMDYGSDAFEYTFSSSMFSGNKLCDRKGCPKGILDLSPCFMGFPFAISKGHFLDTDPRLFDKIEGLKPNRSIHETSVFIDPHIGITVKAHMSTQFSLALGDMSLMPVTRRLSDMYLAAAHAVIKHPKMREEALNSLHLMYYYGPYIMYSASALCVLLGVGLLLNSLRTHSHQRMIKKTRMITQISVMSQKPLLTE